MFYMLNPVTGRRDVPESAFCWLLQYNDAEAVEIFVDGVRTHVCYREMLDVKI